MFDRLLAFVMLIVLSPVFIIVMLFILLDDGMPVFFTQKRVGKDYSFFKLYKFRTMKTDTPNIATLLLGNLIHQLLVQMKFGIYVSSLSKMSIW